MNVLGLYMYRKKDQSVIRKYIIELHAFVLLFIEDMISPIYRRHDFFSSFIENIGSSEWFLTIFGAFTVL